VISAHSQPIPIMTIRRLRIALYSHDTMGLGHMRRNMLLAEELAASTHRPSVLLISGSREVRRFEVARGVDVVSLPALYKDSSAAYHARSLDVSLHDLIAVRSATILGALRAFEPDVFIVDNVPRGAVLELDAALQYLRRRGLTRCILGLRDILDDASDVRMEWARAANFDAVRRSFDTIWVYGDQRVADLSKEYEFPADIARRVRYTGYLDQRVRSGDDAPTAQSIHVDGSTVLCMLGGGQDGLALAEAFARAEFPAPLSGLLVTGPLMSPARRVSLAEAVVQNPRLRVVDFIENPAAAIRAAHSVITMGGYNSVCDVLSNGARALVVPRVVPRAEQLIRAERLSARGLIDMLHPTDATSDALVAWVTAPASPRTIDAVRMHTTQGLHDLLDETLATAPRRVVARESDVRIRHAS
jgi:predicted glycosyltransferase